MQSCVDIDRCVPYTQGGIFEHIFELRTCVQVLCSVFSSCVVYDRACSVLCDVLESMRRQRDRHTRWERSHPIQMIVPTRCKGEESYV